MDIEITLSRTTIRQKLILRRSESEELMVSEVEVTSNGQTELLQK